MFKTMAGLLVLGCVFGLPASGAQTNTVKGARGHRTSSGANSFNVSVPAHDYDLILARPERTSVTLSVLAYRDMEGWVAYGTRPGACTNQTAMRELKRGVPVEFVLGSLQADTQYFYQFHGRPTAGEPLPVSPEFSFHTARSAGSSFSFTMTADVHLDEHTSAAVYQQSLTNITADRPDFHIDLGNLFMTDKHATRDEAAQQYLAQRFYLGQIGASVPVLLALGVHDGESSRYDDGSTNSLADWSNAIRRKYFPNPVPDGFYTGNTASKSPGGPLQDYYAWTWGDALFVVLDPYRYSRPQRSGDGWGWSLGREQYDWLAKTLAGSKAKYKFVFLHNLLSGDQASRGGVEIAKFNEWGGLNPDGTEGFKEHRPGWAMPVHQLLLSNNVTAVFRAHDNFYARQELDGILYLMVPQPSFAGDDRIRDLENYGYKQGVFRGNSGHVRVAVSPAEVQVEYVKATPAAPVADRAELRPK